MEEFSILSSFPIHGADIIHQSEKQERIDKRDVNSPSFHLELAKAGVPSRCSTNAGIALLHCRKEEQRSAGIQLLALAAGNGDQCALLYLANVLLEGVLVPKNFFLAISYLGKAVALGNKEAEVQCKEIWSTDFDKEIANDPQHALDFLKKEVEAENFEAMYKLGVLYLHGDVVEKNTSYAIEDLLRQASRNGHPQASHELGMLFLEGKYGLPKAVESAIHYLRRASRQGIEEKFIIEETVGAHIKEVVEIGKADHNKKEYIYIQYKGNDYKIIAARGKFSTVKKIVYSMGKTYFFKPFYGDDLGVSAEIAGIPKNKEERNLPYRSMFSYMVSKQLKFRVIPKTGLIFNEKIGAGYIQEEARGATGGQFLYLLTRLGELDEIKSNSSIVRKLVQLQLLDALTGQIDRHSNNYYIDWNTNQVFGIDNDYCGGKFTTHPHHAIRAYRYDGFIPGKYSQFEKNLVFSESGLHDKKFEDKFLDNPRWPGWGVLLPPVMDEHMVSQLSRLSKQDLQRIMLPLYFTTLEIAAAQSRLEAIHFHISVLQQRQKLGICSIIKESEWGDRKTQSRLYPDAKGNALPVFTTYLSRDIARASGACKYDELINDWSAVGGRKNARDLMGLSERELNKFKLALNLDTDIFLRSRSAESYEQACLDAVVSS